MMAGAKHFVAAGHADGVDGAICCEPEGGEICHVAKGALRLRIGLTGVMAHGAMPFQGRNPNRAVGVVLRALAELEAEVQAAHGEHEYLGTLVDHADRAAGRRAGADERDAGRRRRVGRRAHRPGGRPRRRWSPTSRTVWPARAGRSASPTASR